MEQNADNGTRPLLLDRNLMIIFAITLVAMMGVSSITPALPEVARAYDISAREIGLLIAAFTVPGVFLSPVIGVLADRFGRKAVIVPSLVLFSIAGGACALTTDYEQLVVLRLLQGIGGASLNTLNMTLIGDIYSGHRRVTAMGYAGGLISATAAGYPLVGGLVALLGWRYAFGLPILGLPVALLVIMTLREPALRTPERLGVYLRKMALLLADRNVLLLFLCGFIIFLALYGPVVTYLPFFLEDRFAYTAPEVGMVIALNAAASAVASFRLGAITRHLSRKSIMAWSLALTAVALAAIPYATSIWPVIVAVIVSGGSMGVALSMVQLLLTESTPAEQRAAIMTLNGAMFRVGQTAGPLAMGGLLAMGGMPGVFFGAAALCAATLLIVLVAMKAGAPVKY